MYEKKLQYPVRVSNRDVRMARNILNQYGGPDGEFSARLNYVKVHTTKHRRNNDILRCLLLN